MESSPSLPPPTGRGQAPPPPPASYGAALAGAPPRTVRTSGLAVASLVLGIVWIYWIGSILAVVFGAVAYRVFRSSVQREE